VPLSRAALGATLAAAALIAASAQAQTAPATVTLPGFRPGPVMTFEGDDRVDRSVVATAPVGTERKWTFDLQVLSLDPDGGAVVRYTLRSSQTTGGYASGDPFWALLKDAPVEIDVDATGMPRKLVNFEAIKARFQTAYPHEAAVYNDLVDPAGLGWMAGMQVRDPLPLGQVVALPTEPSADAFHHVVRTIQVMGVNAQACQEIIARTTTQTVDHPPGAPLETALHTTARISTADGWTVSLSEQLVSDKLLVTHTLQRTTAAGCG
jgi:hypothetical protein